MTGIDPDLQHAVRSLLCRPLLRASGPDAAVAAFVRRPAVRERLQQWFDHNLGWRLVVDRDVIRLLKVPTATPRASQDAPPQDDCVVYCLVLVVLDDAGDQVVITEIAEAVALLSGTRAALPTFDPAAFSHRRRLVRVLRLLVDQGALVPTRDSAATEQDEVDYVERNGNAIYDVDHRAAALLMSCPVPPTRAGVPGGLLVEAAPDTAAGHNRRRRHAIMRRLVDEPVLYLDELSPEEQTYFHSQRPALVREIETMVGGRVEVRAEGAALIDDELSDVRFPRERTVPFAALLLASALASDVAAGLTEDHVVSTQRLRQLGPQLAEQVGQQVKTIGGHPVSSDSVLAAAVAMLSALRLVEPVGGGLRLRPALGRFRRPPTTAPWTLFDRRPGPNRTDA